MKSILAMLALAAPLAAAPMAFGADTDPDATFYKKATEGGIFEVDAGNQAQQKANSQKVKDFAAMMIKDHTAANDKLSGIASSKSITLPTSASVGQMAMKTKLDVLTGDTYDKSYIRPDQGARAHDRTVQKGERRGTGSRCQGICGCDVADAAAPSQGGEGDCRRGGL